MFTSKRKSPEKIVYVGIEEIPSRYCKHFNERILESLGNLKGVDVASVTPSYMSEALESHEFLSATGTIKYKSKQISLLCSMIQTGEVSSGDVILLGDGWFPGIEGVAYAAQMKGIELHFDAILHAGSWTASDSVASMSRKTNGEWVSCFERTFLQLFRHIYVGTNHHKRELCHEHWRVNKSGIDRKVHATGLPFHTDDHVAAKRMPADDRQPLIVFTGRDHPEKRQTDAVKWAKRAIQIAGRGEFVWTMQAGPNGGPLDRPDYLNLLGKATCWISLAKQENFGYSCLEAALNGALPIAPNNKSYPEVLPQILNDTLSERYPFLYEEKQQALNMMIECLKGDRRVVDFRDDVMRKYWWRDHEAASSKIASISAGITE